MHAECAWNKLADALASVIIFEFYVRESDKSEDILKLCSNFIKLSPYKPDVVLNMNDDKSHLDLLFHYSALLCLSVLLPERPKKQRKMEDSNECNDSGMKLTTSPGGSTDSGNSASSTQTRRKRRYGILHNYNVRKTATNRNVNQLAFEETVTQANILTVDAHVTTKLVCDGEAVVVQSVPFVQSNESEHLNDLSPNPQAAMELRSNSNEESEDDQMVDDSNNKNFGSSEGSSGSSSHSSGSSTARQSSYTQFVILVRDKIDTLLLLVLLTEHECF